MPDKDPKREISALVECDKNGVPYVWDPDHPGRRYEVSGVPAGSSVLGVVKGREFYLHRWYPAA